MEYISPVFFSPSVLPVWQPGTGRATACGWGHYGFSSGLVTMHSRLPGHQWLAFSLGSHCLLSTGWRGGGKRGDRQAGRQQWCSWAWVPNIDVILLIPALSPLMIRLISACRARLYQPAGPGYTSLQGQAIPACRARLYQPAGPGYTSLQGQAIPACRARLYQPASPSCLCLLSLSLSLFLSLPPCLSHRQCAYSCFFLPASLCNSGCT